MSFVLLAGLLALPLASVATPEPKKPDGYLVEPRSHGQGVLVLHAWWGLNADVKGFCRRLADAGFVAFAPDLFQGKTAKTRPEAEALVNAFNPKEAEIKAKIGDAAKYLAERLGGKPIGVIGFSFGAPYALWLSNDDPARVGAVVVYYGTGQEEFGKSKASYLGHFAEKDEFEPKAGVESQMKLIRDADRPATDYTYPGTGHWFVEPSVKQAYNKAAADLAWERTLKFLRETLASKTD